MMNVHEEYVSGGEVAMNDFLVGEITQPVRDLVAPHEQSEVIETTPIFRGVEHITVNLVRGGLLSLLILKIC